jgi:uncharacterized membrane protein HdeD (DUF308 family)
MTTYDSSPRLHADNLSTPSFRVCVPLGIVMIIAGILVLGDVMLVTVISTMFIGMMSIAAGGFEVIHAFWTKGWGGFLWQVLLGTLAGLVILTGFPMTGLWVLGFLLGVDLISHGLAWLSYAWQPARRTA